MGSSETEIGGVVAVAGKQFGGEKQTVKGGQSNLNPSANVQNNKAVEKQNVQRTQVIVHKAPILQNFPLGNVSKKGNQAVGKGNMNGKKGSPSALSNG